MNILRINSYDEALAVMHGDSLKWPERFQMTYDCYKIILNDRRALQHLHEIANPFRPSTLFGIPYDIVKE